MSRHPFSEGRPLLAVSGSSWGPARCVVASSLDSVWSSAMVQGTGACSRLSPAVPGPRGGRGHNCRTPPRACSVSNAILTTRKVPGWHVSAYPGATEVAVRAWLVVHFIGGRRAATTVPDAANNEGRRESRREVSAQGPVCLQTTIRMSFISAHRRESQRSLFTG